MTPCLFHAGAECPAASEMEDLDRQIMLRLKAESENARYREALEKITKLLSQPSRYIDDYGDIAQAALESPLSGED